MTTAYSGDFYYEWTVPNDVVDKYCIVASYAGTPGYKESSSTANFRSGSAPIPAPTKEEIVQQVKATLPPAPDYAPRFYAVIALTAIAVIISVYSAFIKKK